MSRRRIDFLNMCVSQTKRNLKIRKFKMGDYNTIVRACFYSYHSQDSLGGVKVDSPYRYLFRGCVSRDDKIVNVSMINMSFLDEPIKVISTIKHVED